jgi:hypothetical protein
MSKKNLMIAILSLLLITVAVSQFIPETASKNPTPSLSNALR